MSVSLQDVKFHAVPVAAPNAGNNEAELPQNELRGPCTVLHSCTATALGLLGLAVTGVVVFRLQRDREISKLNEEYADLVARNATAAAQELAASFFATLNKKSDYGNVAIGCGTGTFAAQAAYAILIANASEEPAVYEKFVKMSRIATLVIGGGTMLAGALAVGAGLTGCGLITTAVGVIGVATALPAPNKLNSMISKANQCWKSIYAKACSCFRSS